MAGPVILCGLGRIGFVVLDYLRALGWPIVVVDLQPPPADHPALAGVKLVRGDCRDPHVLEQAGVGQARGVLILTSNDLVNLATVLAIRQRHADLRIVVRFFNQELMQRFAQLVRNVHAVSKSALAAPVFARTALAGDALGTFPLGDAMGQVGLLRPGMHHPLCGRSLQSIARQFHLHLLGWRRGGGPQATTAPAQISEQLLRAVDPETPLMEGDEVLLAGPQQELTRLAELSPEESAPVLQWGSRFRRWVRVLWRTLREIETPVKWALGIFLAVVFLSVAVYVLGMQRPVGEAFFRTISVMATSADMHGGELHAEWERVFVSVLRLAGIVLTAALTALLTNYLVRARLQGALAEQRIPDRGHIILCGLGNVGFRILEELRQRGASVVVIEQNEQAPLLRSARQLGAAVLVGDGAAAATLRQARLATCQAVIAATSNDLANVNMALLARELAPRVRVVVRLEDVQLAEQLRTTANIRYSLALSALAAPAVVAALFQDRVLCLFRYHQHILAVVEIVVGSEETSLIDQCVGDLAQSWGFVPLELRRGGRLARTAAIPAERLQIDDRLVAVWRQQDLSRFLREHAGRTAEPLP
jgi:Trk K+ transport system NAD-binding subunit